MKFRSKKSLRLADLDTSFKLEQRRGDADGDNTNSMVAAVAGKSHEACNEAGEALASAALQLKLENSGISSSCTSIVTLCHSPTSPIKAIMPTVTRLLYQNLILFDSGQLSAHIIHESNLIEEQDQLRIVLERNEGRALGLAGAYSPTGELAMLAVADASTIIIIEFENSKSNEHDDDERPATPAIAADNSAARLLLTDHLLHRTTGFLYAFDFAPLALALFQTLGLRVANAIDMQCVTPRTRAPLATIKQAIGDLHHVYDDNVKYMFSAETITEPEYHRGDLTNVKFTTPLASRAWIAHYLSQLASMEDRLAQVPPVDTFRLTDDTLEFLAKSSKDFFQLDQKKPTEVTRRFPTSV
ncbi:hypothetical protein K503DRAFT_93824, partial [Rhizopogon vinicolor AM-OR11-026]